MTEQPVFHLTPAQARASWISALRSGKFDQTTGALTRVGEDGNCSHCCMGVACVLFRELEPECELKTRLDSDDEHSHISYDEEAAILPQVVADWLGLKDRWGVFGPSGAIRQLLHMNDDGMSFEKIADVIESEPEGLIS